ncbi:MAG TPA: response regulator transcription factor [Clostridiaceae bacterium]|nr:response regulator transcription factor [Clostridiaceae bacterium]
MYNIIVIDDHKMLREMISETLKTRGFNVVSISGDARDSISLCEKFKPDLILMDICTENNSSGLAYSKIIKEMFPTVKIVLMTGVPDLTFIDNAKTNKVDSFIYKNISSDSLISTIQNTLDGYSLYPNANNPKANTPDVLKDLTDTELNILTEYCKTLDRNDVIKKLGISMRTLKSHISSIYEKTGYDNLAKLAIYCVGNDLIVPNLESPTE